VSDSERKTSSNRTAKRNLPDFGGEETSDGGDFAPVERESDRSGPDIGHDETSAAGDFGPVKRESDPSGPEFGSPGGDFSPVKRKSNRSMSGFGPKASKRGGGGKLSRTETVTVRLDPKLRYLAELAARKQRRTLSSFIEWAIEENLKNIHLDDGGDSSKSIASQSAELWDVDEPDRFATLAFRYPEMLTHDEQVLWKLIKENECLWFDSPQFLTGQYGIVSVKGPRVIEERSLNFKRLREHWSSFKKVARGDLPKSALPSWADDN
jgi:hypothetical protein